MDDARPATGDDLPAVVALARTAIVELSALRGGETWRRQQARREPMATSLGSDLDRQPEAGAFVVGTIDGAVVGYGVSAIEAIDGEGLLAVVSDLYVDPEARGVGVGEAMMDLLVAHAEAHGAVGIDALALPGDRATKNFFETFGLKARAIVVHRPLGAAEAGS